MARKPRLHVPGGFYHVILRGNGGQDIFFDDEDRSHIYLLIEQGVERYGHRIHAFCCMTNHIHFVIQVAEVPLSRIMQNMSFRYTRWVNKKQRRVGHLFQGRYQAILVDPDSYLMELVRYIHLNPVRAHLVRRPEQYRWSGHRAYLGLETVSWLESDWVLSLFAKRLSTCIRRYEAFVLAGKGERHRRDFHHGAEDARVLADDHFLEQILGTPVRKPPQIALRDVVILVSEDYGIDPADLQGPSRGRMHSEARAVVGWLYRKLGVGSVKEVAEHFHRDASTLTRIIGGVDAKAGNSKVLRERLRVLQSTIAQA